MLHKDNTLPEKVDKTAFAVGFLDRLFEGGDAAKLDAKNLEEVIPEGLAMLVFTVCVFHSREKAMALERMSVQERGIG